MLATYPIVSRNPSEKDDWQSTLDREDSEELVEVWLDSIWNRSQDHSRKMPLTWYSRNDAKDAGFLIYAWRPLDSTGTAAPTSIA